MADFGTLLADKSDESNVKDALDKSHTQTED